MTQIMSRVAQGQPLRVTLPLCRSGLGLGTNVMTADGAIPVEFLTPGDRIVTRDAGLIDLTDIAVRTVPMGDLVRIRPSVLDEVGDGRDLVISARQKVLIRDWRAQAMFGKPAVLVEARKMADGAYFTHLTGAAPMRLFQLTLKGGTHLMQIAGGMVVTSVKTPKKVTVSKG
ncbi:MULTISPECIES: Hint domain-containing protein [Maritimibacter]|uniref:Hedgehog/Intein (Hint) domain-containing protein n=1 Tax=Maritimibacter alkaliphilus HTCC2654 TaxID=314271 RepID=A3VKG1_9RHOB|nr:MULTISPECIES: Hint domain-containing protein [Maritimibacter]EAQ11285.1 hypothetical protein RB2654_04631 [Maritimibacter alkaliphilus HTCC2654]MBL6429453.1 Hint domain-containing protein [Maritimibacter sp.]TYP81504.1 Hint domain-containing protein [Maritimibacter alkaliphilus HTCC2654]